MAKTYSVVLVGVEPKLIEIEAMVGAGFSGLVLLGLPGDVARDMRERVRSALESVGVQIPARRLVINFTPNEYLNLSRTPLSEMDFAVAACIKKALQKKPDEEKNIYLGELTLSGEIKPLRNELTLAAAQSQWPNFHFKTPEVGVKGEQIVFQTLRNYFENKPTLKSRKIIESSSGEDHMNQLSQQIKVLKRHPRLLTAVLAASAGWHSVIFAGSPGMGKSFSLHRLPYFLPPLTNSQAKQVGLIHGKAALCKRPFRNPHHTSSAAALVGGASFKPGEVTLAHHGILFLDEFAEFPRSSLEALREPLDSEMVCISKSGGSVNYPAKFLLCAATNPCPCGYVFSSQVSCRCAHSSLVKYAQKLSGPMLDRFSISLCLDVKPQIDILSENICEQLETHEESFIRSFLDAQQTAPEEPPKEFVHQMEQRGFSARSARKIALLKQTFERLCPQIQCHPGFLQSILSYRNLEQELNSKLHMS